MWSMFRVVVVEWILARLGLRWLVGLAVVVPLALVFLIGIPMLIVAGVLAALAWMYFRRREKGQTSTEPSPAARQDQSPPPG